MCVPSTEHSGKIICETTQFSAHQASLVGIHWVLHKAHVKTENEVIMSSRLQEFMPTV